MGDGNDWVGPVGSFSQTLIYIAYDCLQSIEFISGGTRLGERKLIRNVW